MFKWVIGFILITGPIQAEIIGNLSYQLPNIGHRWTIVQQESPNTANKTSAIYYFPEPLPPSHQVDYFSVIVDQDHGIITDVDQLTKHLQNRFPQMSVKVSVIQETPESVIYEWSASSQAKEIVHGWMRTLSSKEGTATISYLTQDIMNAPKLRLPIIQALSESQWRN